MQNCPPVYRMVSDTSRSVAYLLPCGKAVYGYRHVMRNEAKICESSPSIPPAEATEAIALSPALMGITLLTDK